ncbi:MAG TPA: tetratricopeptide repeat protein, partial [Pirellulaceae bacterium]|nr:tetratricopeptide repeat protein [Pirellulaceae bacterium]
MATAIVPTEDVADRVSGYRYAVAVRGGDVWQVETHPDDPSHRIERQAEYQVGSGNHAIAWVAAENGFLTELPVGWFRTEAGWQMNPGYELKNHRFSRPIPPGCVACHGTQATHESPTINRFRLPIADGIDCSRCHGGSEQHIAFWKSPGTKNPLLSAQLVHPGRLAADRANDICLQCHLQGDVSVPIGRLSTFDFQPGQRLIDLRHDFLIAGQPATLGIASHGARMLQSRCYAASGGQLTCVLCHDPHRPTTDFNASSYDAKCLACHQPKACSRPLAEESKRATSGCVGCHMPKQPTREGIHLVFTDHAIRRRPAALASALPPVLAADADVELTSTWPGTKPDAATLGAAYVLLHETMGPQLQSLARGSKLLAETVAHNPKDGDSRYWLGSALLALQRPLEARDELQKVLLEQPTRHEARFRLALAEEALGNTSGATGEYQRLLADVANWREPYERLAQLYLLQHKPAEATGVWRKLVSLQPDAAAYASLALAERLAGASHEQALATVEKALALDSRQPAAYVSRGTLWLLAGRSSDARRDFERALRLDPANTAARQAIDALPGGK